MISPYGCQCVKAVMSIDQLLYQVTTDDGVAEFHVVMTAAASDDLDDHSDCSTTDQVSFR